MKFVQEHGASRPLISFLYLYFPPPPLKLCVNLAQFSVPNFLSIHAGGATNAYTTAEHTTYYFTVNQCDLEQGLDRFAQFFVAPLISQDGESVSYPLTFCLYLLLFNAGSPDTDPQMS